MTEPSHVIISTLEPMLDVQQAAQYLRISPTTLYNWVQAKRLPCFRLGTGPRAPIRFKVADLDGYMRKVKPAKRGG